MTDRLLGFRPVPYKERWPGSPPNLFAPPEDWKKERKIKRSFEQLPLSMVVGTAIRLPAKPDADGYGVTLLYQRRSDMDGDITDLARRLVRRPEDLEIVYTGRIRGLASKSRASKKDRKPAAKKQAAPKKKKAATSPVKFHIGDVVYAGGHEGTLGCRVKKGVLTKYFLSNYHVLTGEPGTLVEIADMNATEAYPAATIHAIHRPQSVGENVVDCAIAKVKAGYSLECDYIQGDTAAPAELNIAGLLGSPIQVEAKVLKVGAASGGTTGTLMHIAASVSVELDLDGEEPETFLFSGQYMISPASFCEPGDSGSVVFTEDMQAFGLLFASGHQLKEDGTKSRRQYAFANPLHAVFSKLGISLWAS